MINLTSSHTCCVCSHLFKSTDDNYPSEVKRLSDTRHNYCVYNPRLFVAVFSMVGSWLKKSI